MIKVGRKYKVGYDILEAGPKPRKLLPIWHHIGIKDNYSWNKKLATYLRKEHKIIETGQLEEFTKSNSTHCKKAKLQARIKPTALCSAIDKENLIESPLDLLHYIYNYYRGYASCFPQFLCLSADFFVTFCDCDLWLCVWCDHCYDLSHTFVTLWLSCDISHALP